jgi:hypothetical protein
VLDRVLSKNNRSIIFLQFILYYKKKNYICIIV